MNRHSHPRGGASEKLSALDSGVWKGSRWSAAPGLSRAAPAGTPEVSAAGAGEPRGALNPGMRVALRCDWRRLRRDVWVTLVGATPMRTTTHSPPRSLAIQLAPGSAARIRSTSCVASSRFMSLRIVLPRRSRPVDSAPRRRVRLRRSKTNLRSGLSETPDEFAAGHGAVAVRIEWVDPAQVGGELRKVKSS